MSQEQRNAQMQAEQEKPMPIMWANPSPEHISAQDEAALDIELAAAMRRKLNRLAKAQALAWNALEGDVQQSYLTAVDRLEANRG